MKLTKQQITALADKIYKETSKLIKDYNDKLIDSINLEKELENFLKPYRVALKLMNENVIETFSIRYKNTNYNICYLSVKELIKNNTTIVSRIRYDVIDKLPLKKNIFSIKDIENDIILETIDLEDGRAGLDELISKLTNKYANN